MFDMRNLSLLKKLDENAPDAMKAFWVFERRLLPTGRSPRSKSN
jgi:hypothetical protein